MNESEPRRLPLLLAWVTAAAPWLVPLGLVLALYWPVLNLPFFWDDAANFNWMNLRPLASIWRDATGFPYYRPMGFSVWRLIQLAFGPTNTVAFHIVDLAAHTTNAWLAGAIAARFAGGTLSRQRLVKLLAGSLMAAFPFAAPVVSHVAQDFHLLVTGLTLGAIVCALKFRETRDARWGAATVLLGTLAPFEHESGVVTGALVTLTFILMPEPSDSRGVAFTRKWWPAAAALATNAGFLVVWSLVSKTREAGVTWVGWESIGQSIVFFLEGLTFPVQALAVRLMSWLGWSDLLAVAVLASAALCVAVATMAIRPRNSSLRGLLFCLGYWAVAAAPVVAVLPFSYVIVSPRLQMFPAPAAAILWALTIERIGNRLISERSPFGSPAVSLITAGLLLAAPVAHVASIIRLHRDALSPVRQLATSVGSEANRPTLVVNAPNWVAPARPNYPLGHEGVEIMPSYVTPQMLVWVNTRTTPSLDGVSFSNVFPQLNDRFFDAWGQAQDWESMAALVPQYERVLLWQYSDGAMQVHDVGRVQVAEIGPSAPYLAEFNSQIRLVSGSVVVTPGEVMVELTWQGNGPATLDVFTHVLGCDGALLGQRDGATLGGIYPIWLWPEATRVLDIRHVAVPVASADDCVRVAVGLFNPADGTRAPAVGPDGIPLPDEAVMLSLE